MFVYDADAGSLTLRDKINGSTYWDNFASISPNGKFLAYPETHAAESGNTVKIVDLETKAVVGLPGSDSRYVSAVFSPDSRDMVTVGANGVDGSGRVTLWTVSGSRLHEWEQERPRTAVVFSPSNDLLAVADADSISIRNTRTGELVESLDVEGEIRSLAFDPDGTRLYCGVEESLLIAWNVTGWSELGKFREHADAVRCVVHSPHNPLLATASRDNTIKLWNPKALHVVATLKGHSGIVNSVAFSPAANVLASASQDYSVILWDLSFFDRRSFLPSRNVSELAVVGQTVNYVYGQSYRENWPGNDLQMIASHDLRTDASTSKDYPTANVVTIAKSPSDILAIATKEAIELWRSDTHTLQDKFAFDGGIPGGKHAMAYSPSGRHLAIGLDSGHVLCWNLESNDKACRVVAHKSAVMAVVFSPDDRLLCTGATMPDVDIGVWEVSGDSLTRVKRLQGHVDNVEALTFSPKGQYLASGSFDNTIRIWSPIHGETLKELRGHSATVHDLEFSSDGRTLVSAGGDRTIRIWDAKEWVERCVLKGHDQEVTCVEWIDSRTIVSGGRDGVRFWQAATDERIQKNWSHVGHRRKREMTVDVK